MHAAGLPSKLLGFMEVVQCFYVWTGRITVSIKISNELRVMWRRLLPRIALVAAMLRNSHRELPT